ncbi:MAG: hypothetical protein IJY83_05655 [Oscillospiraceae bacterium]|nr:hypothetical protein [Oscillospiraceae bacterium]
MVGHLLASIGNALTRQVIYNTANWLTLGVSSEYLCDYRSFRFVLLKTLVVINHITVGDMTAVEFSFDCIFGHSSACFQFKVFYIIFRKSLKY